MQNSFFISSFAFASFWFIRLSKFKTYLIETELAFRRFGHAKFPNGGLVLDFSQFSVLPQLPPKRMLSLKEVKIDSKICNSLC